MRRRDLDRQISRAIAQGRQDADARRVTNWCRHIEIKQNGVSLLGQMVGLPIGPKEISCPNAMGRIGGAGIEQTAALFIRQNCVGCPYHEEVSPDNIGRAIIAGQTTSTEPFGAQPSKMNVPSTAQIELDRGAVPDEALRSYLAQLLAPESRAVAASTLRTLARRSPGVFTETILGWIESLFSNLELGETMLDLAHAIAVSSRAMLPRIAAAVISSSERLSADAWSRGIDILSEAIRTDPQFAMGLPPQVLERLFWDMPVDFVPSFLDERSRRNGRELIAAILTSWSTAFDDLVRAALVDGDDAARVHAAAIVEVTVEVDPDHAATFGELLLDSLERDSEYSDYHPDVAAARALAHLMALHSEVIELARRRYSVASPDVRAVLLRTRRYLVEVSYEAGRAEIPWLIEQVVAAEISVDLRRAAVDTLDQMEYGRPNLFAGHTDILLGALALVSEQTERLANHEPLLHVDQTAQQVAVFQQMGDEAQLESCARQLREFILHSEAPGELAMRLVAMLATATAHVPERFRAELLALVGMAAAASDPERASEVGRLLLAELFTPDSTRLRGAAAGAFAVLAEQHPECLNDDALLALCALLNDEYVYPISQAIAVFEHTRIIDSQLARSVAERLAGLHRGFWSDHYKLRSLGRALANLARQHPELRPLADRMLVARASHGLYYARLDALGDLARRAQQDSTISGTFVRAVFGFHTDFRVHMTPGGMQRMSGEQSDEFYDLYSIQSEVLIAELAAIQVCAAAQTGEIADNLVVMAEFVGFLEQPDLAASWLANRLASLPREIRHRNKIALLRGRELHARAEAALTEGQLDPARELLTEALSVLRDVEPERSMLEALVPGIVLPKRERPQAAVFWVKWLSARVSLLDVLAALRPTDDEALAAADSSLGAIAGAYVELEGSFGQEQQAECLMCRAQRNVVLGLREIVQWVAECRRADRDAERHLVAARMTFQAAMEAADAVAYPRYRADLRAVADVIRGLTDPLSLVQLVAKACVSMPVPRFWPWSERTSRATLGASDGDARQSDRPVSFAVVSTLLDQSPIATPHRVVVDTLHDLTLRVDALEVPADTETLRFRLDSTAPPGTYAVAGMELAGPTIPRAPFELASSIRFSVAQLESSSPILLQLVGEAVRRDGSVHPFDVFGESSLRLVLRRAKGIETKDSEILTVRDRVLTELDRVIPASAHNSREQFRDVLTALLQYAARQLRDPYIWPPDADEKHFQRDLAGALYWPFGRECIREVKSGCGFVDIVVGTIPVELKICVSTNIAEFVQVTAPQAAQYSRTQFEPIGFLCVLDLAQQSAVFPGLDADVALIQVPQSQGLSPGLPATVAAILVRGRPIAPSRVRQ